MCTENPNFNIATLTQINQTKIQSGTAWQEGEGDLVTSDVTLPGGGHIEHFVTDLGVIFRHWGLLFRGGDPLRAIFFFNLMEQICRVFFSFLKFS